MEDPPTQEEEIFEAARMIADPVARCAYLDSACGENRELRKRVEGLLAANVQADSFFQESAAAIGEAPLLLSLTEQPGDRIGRYKLLEKIGEGGCGLVYMAEQNEPVRRKVALKIIKLGMDTKQVVARFEAERQALAMMDHPGIAKVFDAGATEAGRPYFVMELVCGTKITDYCDDQRLSTRQRTADFHTSMLGGAARASERDHSPGY